MADPLTLNKSLNTNPKKLEHILSNFEKISEIKSVRKTDQYNNWKYYFTQVYGSRLTNLRLYLFLGLLYYLGYLLVLKFIFNNRMSINLKEFTIKKFNDLKEKIRTRYHKEIILRDDYFHPIFQIFEDFNTTLYQDILSFVETEIFTLDIPLEYVFDFLIQNYLSKFIRHKSGEFYTPKFLTKKMVDGSYKFGEKVLDPSCGSANFLIEILKDILQSNKSESEINLAINNLYGYDINPISIFLAKINFLLLLREDITKVKLNLFIMDSLFPGESIHNEKFDLVIGNPPWYTLRDIESIDYQNKIKSLAEKLRIKPRPKNVLNIEISSLFFYKAKTSYMKKNSKIFFVITKGIINGSHASRFRNFEGFKDLKMWTFGPRIKKIFNIDFICLYARKSNYETRNRSLEVPVYYFILHNSQNNINYFENVEITLKSKKVFIPYHIEKKGDKIYIHKLVSKEEFKKLLPIKPSSYKKLFHKGADLNPRNLIFVRCKNYKDSLVKINPEEKIFKRAKAPWNKIEFTNEIIESQYIFKVVKSTELVKFFIYDSYQVFLPISKKDLSFNYQELSENAKRFYEKINRIYLKYKKDTTKNNSLMDNLNRWSKLITNRQKAKIKVIYNNSGAVLNSAVIQGDYLITGDLCFYDTQTLEEAYYLSAILNSPLINKQVKIKKSSRHIFKIPLDNPIKKFNTDNENHRILANLGKKGQIISERIYKNFIRTLKQIPSKMKLQKILNRELKQLLTEIDKFVLKEFQS
ncbi:MAG: class I SAM-dependent DNA methyltransferase [Promethearchaeota archaeon]